MAKAVVTMKIMPTSPEIDMEALAGVIDEKIKAFADTDQTKKKIEPVAFGLKSLEIMFLMEESKGSTDDLEQEISTVEGVNSVEVTDVRRAVG